MKSILVRLSNDQYKAFKEYCKELGFDSDYSCARYLILQSLKNKIDNSLLPLDIRIIKLEEEVKKLKQKIEKLERSGVLSFMKKK